MKAKKELLISLMRPGKKTAVVQVERELTLGRDYACDITIESARLPERHLFIKRSGKERFIIKLLEGMDGSVRKGKESSRVSTLIETGFIKKRGAYYPFELTPGLTLTLVIGDATIEASYGEPRYAGTLGQPPKKLRAFIPFVSSHEQMFLATLIISAIIHISFAYYLSTIEIKKKTFEERIYEIPPRLARLILMPEKKAVERYIAEVMEEKKPEEEKEGEREEKRVSDKKASIKEAKAEKEKLVKKIATKGVLGVIGAKKGLIDDAGVERLWREVDEIIKGARSVPVEEQTIEGIGEGIISANGEDTLKGLERKKTTEDIIKEKTALARVTPDRKKPQEKRKREEADVYRIVRSYVGGLKYLYNNALRKNPKLRGTITVRLVITKNGDVEKAAMENSTLSDPELEHAIVERIHLWRFGSIKDAEIFVIDYTFDFSPIG